jgi:hypothetical protein
MPRPSRRHNFRASQFQGVSVTVAAEPVHGADPETPVMVATAVATDADMASDTVQVPEELVTQVNDRLRDPPAMVTETVSPLTDAPAVAVTVIRARASHPLLVQADTSASVVDVCGETVVVVEAEATVVEVVEVVEVVVVVTGAFVVLVVTAAVVELVTIVVVEVGASVVEEDSGMVMVVVVAPPAGARSL